MSTRRMKSPLGSVAGPSSALRIKSGLPASGEGAARSQRHADGEPRAWIVRSSVEIGPELTRQRRDQPHTEAARGARRIEFGRQTDAVIRHLQEDAVLLRAEGNLDRTVDSIRVGVFEGVRDQLVDEKRNRYS